MRLGPIHLDFVLAGPSQPIVVMVAGLGFHHQRPNPATLGNDIGASQRSVQIQALVDVVEHEPPVLVRHLGKRRRHRGIGGTDAGARTHRNDEEQAPIVGEESQNAWIEGDPGHDQMDTLGKHMAVFGLFAGQRVMVVHERTGGIDQHSGADFHLPAVDDIPRPGNPDLTFAASAERFHVVGRDTTAIHGRAHELKYEAGIVIGQVGVGIFEAADSILSLHHRLFPSDRPLGQQARGLGKPVTEQPIQPGTRPQEQGMKVKPRVDAGEKTDLSNPRRVVAEQLVTA